MHLMCCISLKRQSMFLAIDILHGHGLSNKMRPQLQPKKTQVMAVLVTDLTVQGYMCCKLLTRWGALVLTMGVWWGSKAF